MVFGFLLLPVSGIFKCHTGWPRNVMAMLTIALALLGIGGIVARFAAAAQPDATDTLVGLFVFGIIASTWIVNLLLLPRPKR
jgi:hypothetical protein